MARRDQKLYRDHDDQVIAGVCSGVANYFDVDTTLVRVLFVALALAGGGAFLAYPLLWYFVDEAPVGYFDDHMLDGQGTLDLTDERVSDTTTV